MEAVESERGSSTLTGGPFGSLPTLSVRQGPRSVEPVTEPWGFAAVATRSRAFDKPRAEPAPRARAIAVVAVFAMTTATVAAYLLRLFL